MFRTRFCCANEYGTKFTLALISHRLLYIFKREQCFFYLLISGDVRSCSGFLLTKFSRNWPNNAKNHKILKFKRLGSLY